MTSTTARTWPTVPKVPTEKVTLELQSKAVYAARVAALTAQVSVEEWISRTLWAQAISESAEHSAEQDPLHPDHMKDWAEEIEKNMFMEGEE
jgi:hypothetical protein